MEIRLPLSCAGKERIIMNLLPQQILESCNSIHTQMARTWLKAELQMPAVLDAPVNLPEQSRVLNGDERIQMTMTVPTVEVSPNAPVRQVGFLLLPGTTMTCFSSAINVLRHANKVSGRVLYQWRLYSTDGQPVMTEEGFEIGAGESIEQADAETLDKLVVCGGYRFGEHKVLRSLKRIAEQGVQMGSMGAGCYPLARAGLLDGYQCTSHWEYLPALEETFPQLNLSSQLYVVDRNRFSCAGGGGVQDMMLNLLGAEHGPELALAVSEMLICGVRHGSEPQRGNCRRALLGYSPPVLDEAISLMESNIEEPLKLQELSDVLGISRRQLERLFSKYLNSQPSRYYMELRLKRAREMLQQTNKSILEISIACGFSSPSHFSRSIKERFGCPPKALCKQAAA